MTQHKLLFCNPLKDIKADWLRNETGLCVEIAPLIKFREVPISEWLPQFQANDTTWVFTSKRAAQAILKVYSQLPEPGAIYCVGPTTASYFDGFPIPVYMPMEFNSEALTQLLLQDNVRNSVHFRGNLSGDDLVKNLLQNGVIAKGIEVYQTIKNPQSVSTDGASAMVFMSPSAIEAFTEKNNIEAQMPVFCIGATTGEAARKQGFEKVLIPDNYSLESLAQTIKSYFNE